MISYIEMMEYVYLRWKNSPKYWDERVLMACRDKALAQWSGR